MGQPVGYSSSERAGSSLAGRAMTAGYAPRDAAPPPG